MIWFKYLAFEKGISPREFRRCRIKDLKEIMTIKNAIQQKKIREDQIQDAVNRMGM